MFQVWTEKGVGMSARVTESATHFLFDSDFDR